MGRGEGRRGVLSHLDAIAATKNELQRISTIYVGWKTTDTCALAGRGIGVYVCDVDGCAVGSLRPGIQERGRLPSNRGIGGTGESFRGEHGLRVRALVSAVNAAKAGGASEVRLRVECTNAGAVKMYEQQGFIVDVGRGVDGISFDLYGPTRHATNMVLNVEGDNWVLPRVLGP